MSLELAASPSANENANAAIQVYVGLGANLNEPNKQLLSALQCLADLPQTLLLKKSSFYQSAPMGPQDQDDYINAVALLETHLAPLQLLDQLQAIENKHGRKRIDERWAPRTLDLDILLYGEQQIQSERLTVPHYGMKQRNFVLIPLKEINPTLILPDGTSIQLLANASEMTGIIKL